MAPTKFTNLFFRDLVNRKWTPRDWKGPAQFEDASKKLMMLPSDLALTSDPHFKEFVDLYAKDAKKFSEDFAKAFSKLLELGVEFPKSKL